MRHPIVRYTLALAVSLAAGAPLGLAADRARDLHKIPRQVLEALEAKFPKAEINKWSKETEAGIVVYDLEFEQEDHKFEADIKEDGTFHNWERQIPVNDLPDAVRKAVESRYPKSALKEVMAITAVKDGMDALEGYEIALKPAGHRGVEVTLAPDGKFLEASGKKE